MDSMQDELRHDERARVKESNSAMHDVDTAKGGKSNIPSSSDISQKAATAAGTAIAEVAQGWIAALGAATSSRTSPTAGVPFWSAQSGYERA